MRWQTCSLLVPLLSSTTTAIFADDAYHLDYHQALLGQPQSHTTFFHKPQSSSNASLLYTVSDKAVLGAINPKDGSVLWRQALAGEPVTGASPSFLVAVDGDGQVMSGFAGAVSAWDALDGKLVWEYKLKEGDVVAGLQAVPMLEGSAGVVTQDVIVLVGTKDEKGSSNVIRLAGDGTGKIWEHSGSDMSVAIAVNPNEVFYVSKSSGPLGGKTKVAALDIISGRESRLFTPSLDSEVLTSEFGGTAMSCSSFPFLATSEKPYKTVRLNILGTNKVITLSLDDKGKEVEALTIQHPCNGKASPHLLIHIKTKTKQWAEVFHINIDSQTASKAYSLPETEESSVFAASSIDSNVYFTRITDTEVVLHSSASHGILSRWVRRGADLVPRLHATAEVVNRGKTGLAVRVAITSARGAWELVRNGDLQWTRPEMLAYATTAVWADTYSQQGLASELEAEVSANPIAAYLHRLQRHTEELLLDFPAYLLSLPQTFTKSSSKIPDKSRTNMLGGKTLLAATSRQELAAVDGIGGELLWTQDLSPYMTKDGFVTSLFVENGRVWTYFSDGSLAVLNNTSGEVIEQKKGSIATTKMLAIPGLPAGAIVKISADGTPKLPMDFTFSSATEGNSILTVSPEGVAMGWTIGQESHKTWTIKPPTGAKIISAIGRPSHDPVASIGKVLGDRSVLYKYLSPNLAMLTAISSSTLTIYLINAITGTILHTMTHTGVDTTSPISAAMSENWFAYSFTSTNPSVTTQLIISELYESAFPNDRGALGPNTHYSSFAADAIAKPYIISQSFTIAEPISRMSVTQTTQGITSRQLLATLPNSNAIVGIPLGVLNARRPIDRDPTPLEMEEGLFKYNPTLELDAKWYLTHSREVLGIEKVISSPSMLESTSLIFGFGHDIFGTRVSPSMAFDILGKGFNRVQLLLTIMALAVGVSAVAPFVRRRMVDGRWKA